MVKKPEAERIEYADNSRKCTIITHTYAMQLSKGILVLLSQSENEMFTSAESHQSHLQSPTHCRRTERN